MKNYSCLDGEVSGIELGEAVMGSDKVSSKYIDPSVDDMYYSASGGIMSGFRKRRDERQKQKRIREESKADARKTKANAKLEQAKSQSKQADALANQGPDNTAELLANSQLPPDEPKSKLPMILGISAGVIVVGILGYVAYKHFKKK